MIAVLMLVYFFATIAFGSNVDFTQTSPSYSPVCPGDTVVFTCITNGTGRAYWRLNNAVTFVSGDTTSSNVGSLFVTVIPNNGTNLTSTGTIEPVPLNGATVSCSATPTPADFLTLTINVSGILDAVSNVTIIPSTNSSVVLSWSPVHCVVNYTITVLSDNIDVRIETTNTTSVAIDNLTVGMNYSFTVNASDTIGRVGPSSSPLNYTWNVPVQVQNVSWLQVSANTITISWTAVEDTHPTNLYYLIITDPILLNTTINTTDTAVNITGLSPGEVYTINISAVNIIGAGPVASVNDVSVTITSSASSVTVFIDTTSFLSFIATSSSTSIVTESTRSSTTTSVSTITVSSQSNIKSSAITTATTSLPVTTSVSNTPLSTVEEQSENTSVYPIAGAIGGVVLILIVIIVITILVVILSYRKRNIKTSLPRVSSNGGEELFTETSLRDNGYEPAPDPTYAPIIKNTPPSSAAAAAPFRPFQGGDVPPIPPTATGQYSVIGQEDDVPPPVPAYNPDGSSSEYSVLRREGEKRNPSIDDSNTPAPIYSTLNQQNDTPQASAADPSAGHVLYADLSIKSKEARPIAPPTSDDGHVVYSAIKPSNNRKSTTEELIMARLGELEIPALPPKPKAARPPPSVPPPRPPKPH